MKNIIFLIITVAIGGSVLKVQGQGIRSERVIKTTALQVYEKYISAIKGLGKQSYGSEERFLELFDKETDSLCNDILPDINQVMLTPNEYVDKYRKSVKRAYYNYLNLKMGVPFSDKDKWNIYCTFECDVQYVDKLGIVFPSTRFKYLMRIEMDKKSSSKILFDNGYIASLTLVEPVTNYVVIHNPSGRFTLDGNRFLNNAGVNSVKDYWVGDLGNSNIESIQSESLNPFTKTSFEKMSNYYNRYEHLSSKIDVVGLGMYYTPIVFGDKYDFQSLKKTSNVISLRGFWGKNLISNDNGSFFFNAGLGLFRKSSSLSGKYEVHYMDEDIDGDYYQRNIVANLNKESITSFGVCLPLSFSYLLALNDPKNMPLLLSVEAGFTLSYKAISMQSFDMDARYTGTYDYFGGIEFDHYYDYGNYNLNRDRVETDFNSQMNRINVAAMVGLGFWMGMFEHRFLRLDISLTKDFVSEMKYKGDYRLTSRYDDYHSAFQSSNTGAFDFYVGLSYIITLE